MQYTHIQLNTQGICYQIYIEYYLFGGVIQKFNVHLQRFSEIYSPFPVFYRYAKHCFKYHFTDSHI